MGWVIVGGIVLGGGFLLVRDFLAQPAPPASLRCGTCPKLQRQLQGWRLGAGVLAGLLVVTFVWALSR